MKVFISWSGPTSKNIAKAVSDWLPSVLQMVEPFFSNSDLEKGSRWATELAQSLKDTNFGIACLTPDNLASPWLNFEAGASVLVE